MNELRWHLPIADRLILRYLSGLARAIRKPEPHRSVLRILGPGDRGRLSSTYRRGVAVYALSRSDDTRWAERLFTRMQRSQRNGFPTGVTVSVAGGELTQMATRNQTVMRERKVSMLRATRVIPYYRPSPSARRRADSLSCAA